MVGPPQTSRTLGRPAATSHAAIEHAAFELFTQRGFDRTTLDDIAEQVGVSRRTLFRYFESKNDIPWGQFSDSLNDFAVLLRSFPDELPLADSVHAAVVAFNSYEPSAMAQHLERMKLILRTPTLQAHSALRYAEWRGVIADYVAERCGGAPDDIGPRTIGHVSLALSLSAYDEWLDHPTEPLGALLDDAMAALRDYVA